MFTVNFMYGNSQSPDWEWVNRIGDINYDQMTAVALDDSGNVYVTGVFQGNVDFDPGIGVFYMNSNLSYGDIFISKFDSAGNFIWAKGIIGSFAGVATSIVVDTIGSNAIYVTGYFEGITDFDPGPGTYNLTSSNGGDYDIFILKLNQLGDFEWATPLATFAFDFSTDLEIGAAGKLYITGNLGNQIFISKSDSMGNIEWTKSITGNGVGKSLVVDRFGNGDVYYSGSYNGLCDFDPGTGVFNLNGNGGFFSSLDSSGNFLFAKKIGGDGKTLLIDFNGSKDVYLGGVLTGTQDFDPDTSVFNLSSVGLNDICISKITISGNLVWASSLGGPNLDEIISGDFVRSGNNKIIYVGDFHGTVDFDPGPAIRNLTAAYAAGYGDGFMLEIDTSGSFAWAKSIGGSRDDFAYDIALDDLEKIYVVGYFYSSSISFGQDTIYNAGPPWSPTSDMFIAKLDTGLIYTNTNSEVYRNAVVIFPNPASTSFTITGNSFSQNAQIEIFNLLGKKIYSAATCLPYTVDCRLFPPGIYLVKLQSENSFAVQKLIVE